jgi:aminoglycoside 2''-phosphotransferase
VVDVDVPYLAASLRHGLSSSDRAAVPELLEVGFSSTVLRIGSTVARVARNADAAAGYQRQLTLLPVVADHLSIAVPSELRLVPPAANLPFGALLSDYISGRPMVLSDAKRNPGAAAELAIVLTELHDVPWAELPPDSIGSFEPIAELRRLRAETEAELHARLEPSERRAFDRRWRAARELLPSGPTTFCHGDPWFGNFLVDERSRLVALLDFEDACIGDPALDLAAVFHLPGTVAEDVVVRYLAILGVEDSIRERIALHRVIREVAGLAYVLRNDQREEIDVTVGRLRRLLDDVR